MDLSHKDSQPWYKQPLVWMLIGIPGSAVIMGVVMLNLAIVSNDGLVTDDYYKKGLEINKSIKRDRRADEQGLTASIEINPERRELSINLSAQDGFEYPAQILVEFQHSTRAGFDSSLIIDKKNGGNYPSVLPELVSGRWNVQISAADWRLVESLSYHQP